MSHQFARIMFTDGVKAAQEEYGSRARLERFSEMAGPNDELTDREADFIAQRDTFYIATVNEDALAVRPAPRWPAGVLEASSDRAVPGLRRFSR